MKTKFYFFLAAMMVLGFILLTCTEKPPTAPGRTNPLDENNPDTGGDPFNLTAQIAGGGIQLTWNIVPLGTVSGYNIHRKVDDGTFELEYQVNGKYTSSFVDTLIQNGHKYSYYIVTRNSEGQESTSNTAEVFIITDPLLQIDDQNGYTPSRVVNLTLLAYGAAKMQVGTPDLSDAGWVNYATSTNITLPTGSGTKTVQARFVYTNGDTSAVVSHVTQPTGMNPAFNIAHNAQYASTRQVWLYPIATGSNLKCQFSENNQFTEAIWENYADSVNFTLSTGSGNKTVYCKIKNDFEVESSVLYDQITPQPMNPAFNIAHNSANTSTRQVWLFPTAAGSNLKCQFSENNQFTGASWVNYADSVSFILSTGSGNKTVYCKVKNDFEIESAILSDQISPLPMNPAFNINNNAAETELTAVTLYLSAQGSNLKYMASENSSFSGADWQNYLSQVSFTLSSGSGTKTVYAKYKNDFEVESSVLSDAISYVYCISPSSLTASANETSITLNWIDNSNVEQGYRIERKTGSGGSYIQIGTSGANAESYIDNGLAPGIYYYRVCAYNSQGNSDYSNEAAGTAEITAPSNLSASLVSLTQINLAWADNSNVEEGYKVERKTGTGGSYSQVTALDSNAVSYSDTGLQENTTYLYRVRAYNGSSNSSYSNEADATTTYTAGYEQTFPLGTTGLSIEMVYIPAGSFLQGRYSGEQGSYSHEDPQHLVTLDYGFWLGKYEVTQAQWEAIAGSWSFYFDGHPDYPAEMVSWNDITNTFLPALNSQTTGSPWRLPSESEWEYACRAGTTTRYYWGDDPSYSQIGNYAWYSGNSGNTTHTVGTRQPNGWGLYDMSGNVWEWCEDYWHSNYSGAPTNGDPWLSPSSSFRVLRGGSWGGDGSGCRSALRSGTTPSYRGDAGGFRLVRSL